MGVVASLVPGQSYKTQIVIDDIPEGAAWRLVGHIGDYQVGLTPSSDLVPSVSLTPEDSVFTAAAYSWVVPGGFGVGDGGQVVLVDSRSPGNVPVVYTLELGGEQESSYPVVVPFQRDAVLQTLDGLHAVDVQLVDGSLDFSWEPQQAQFRIPGRSRPVVRYDVLGVGNASLVFALPMGSTQDLRRVLTSGAPIVYRLSANDETYDVDLASVIAVTGVTPTAYPMEDLRVWSLTYVPIDDPAADVRLGAFTWDDGFDAAFAGRPWVDFDQAFVGAEWDAFDTADWTVV